MRITWEYFHTRPFSQADVSARDTSWWRVDSFPWVIINIPTITSPEKRNI